MSALSFLGVIIGAVAGILLAPHVISGIDDDRARLFAGVSLIIVFVVIGEIAGMVLGRALRGGIRRPGSRAVDSAFGAAVQSVAVMLAAWLLAIPLASSSQPTLAAAVRGSSVLSHVDSLAPEWLRDVPAEFASLLDTSGLPEVIGPFGRTPVAEVDPPTGVVLNSPVAARLQPSVLKILGVAPSCQRALEGTGFIFAPEQVVTNAHVVAGTTGVTVESSQGVLDGTVVAFDPRRDIAVIHVAGLEAPALEFAGAPATSGQEGVVLGYPGGGPYTAVAARVREELNLSGPNIYRSGNVDRDVYTVRGSVRQGNSGGPLVDADGRVLGVVFGAAVDDADTGFALTLNEVQPVLTAATSARSGVDTGACVL